MTRSPDLLERLEQVNPVPDPNALFRGSQESQHFFLAVQQRRDQMQDTDVTRLEPADPQPPNRRWLLAAAAFALVLAVGIAVVLATGGSETDVVDEPAPPTTLAPSTTTPGTTIAEEPAIVDTAESAAALGAQAMAAYQAGDLDGFFVLFADDATTIGSAYRVENPDVRNEFEFWMALGPRVSGVDCSAEQALDILGLPSDAYNVRCQVRFEDQLTGPAGIVIDGQFLFKVESGEITDHSLVPSFESDPREAFLDAMTAWLQQAYPEVWSAGFALTESCDLRANCRNDEWQLTAETAAVLLEYGPEFIAQSDQYPIEP